MRRWKSLRNRKPLRASRGALDAREQQERRDFATVRARAKGRCEVRIGGWRCERRDVDTHHVIKRSQGGKFKGPDYLIRVCRECHDLTDAATTQLTTYRDKTSVYGRLRIAATGGGKFRCWMESGRVKRQSVSRETGKAYKRRPVEPPAATPIGGEAGVSPVRVPDGVFIAPGWPVFAPKAPERSEAS